jgi:biofilm PGA synthesis N-glycosyltransferase PgaC
MSTAVILFWLALAILFYCYIGYGIILSLFNKLRGAFKHSPVATGEDWIGITLIIAAYNEKEIIEKKITNCLDIDYPADKLSIIFITDGSSDDSPQLVAQFTGITLLHQQERRGKMAAIKRAMQIVKSPVVVFSDANTLLNKDCLKRIAVHYADPRTGGVAGEKRIVDHGAVSAVGEAEGLYWKYESFLKTQDAGFYTVVGAAGELFSIRTQLFRTLPDSIILDDFLISMQVCLQHYRIGYEPGAYAIESPSASLAEEEKRKIRISAGAYQSVAYLKECLNVFKYPLLGFQYISRRLFRWIVCPLMLVVLLITNTLLVKEAPSSSLYSILLGAQLLFYFLSLPGWFLVRSGKKAGLLSVPFYFVFMNYCLVKGFIRYLNGSQSVLWEKSLRQAELRS